MTSLRRRPAAPPSCDPASRRQSSGRKFRPLLLADPCRSQSSSARGRTSGSRSPPQPALAAIEPAAMVQRSLRDREPLAVGASGDARAPVHRPVLGPLPVQRHRGHRERTRHFDDQRALGLGRVSLPDFGDNLLRCVPLSIRTLLWRLLWTPCDAEVPRSGWTCLAHPVRRRPPVRPYI